MKIKNLLLLTVFLLLFVKGQGQHYQCIHDSLLHIRKQQNPHIDKWENEKINEFKKYHPEFPNYPKPQPQPDCEMCPLNIDPECVHTQYMLPVLVHIVAQPGHTTIGQNRPIARRYLYINTKKE